MIGGQKAAGMGADECSTVTAIITRCLHHQGRGKEKIPEQKSSSSFRTMARTCSVMDSYSGSMGEGKSSAKVQGGKGRH